MKLKRVLIYLIILVLVGGWLYLVEIKHKQEKKAAEEKAAKLISLERDKIAGIELKSTNRTIELKKPANQWVMTAPVRTKADDHTVESLLNSAIDAKSEKVLSENDFKPEDYGLDKPEFTVTLTAPEGNARMEFGARNPAKTGYYARIEGDQRLFLLSDSLKIGLDKSVLDLRDKTVMGIAPADVDKMVVSQNGKQTELQLQSPGKWVMTKPEQLAVKQSILSRDIMNLANMQAKDVIDEPRQNGDPYGLDNPQQFIVLSGKKLTQTLLVGKAIEKEEKTPTSEPDRYARVKDHDTVYVVDGRTIKDLFRVDPEYLQDRALLSFDPQVIEKAEFELDGRTWVAVRNKDTKQAVKWNLEQPEKLDNVEAWPISSILWDLRDLEWKSSRKGAGENLASAHLDKPKLIVSLFKEGEAKPIILKAGWEDVKPPVENSKGQASTEEGKQAEKAKSKIKEEAQNKNGGEPSETTAGKAVLPPTVNALVEPSEEKDTVFIVNSAFIDRLRTDLDRLLEKKK